MSSRTKYATSLLACIFLIGAPSASAQQKPQWMPGQVGLNAGILPSPGFTYVNESQETKDRWPDFSNARLGMLGSADAD